MRKSFRNHYLLYCHRNDWNTDKKLCCRLQLNRNQQSGGILIFGGNFDSIDPITFIIDEKFQALETDSAIITGRILEQASRIGRNSSMAATIDSVGNAVSMGGWDEVEEEIQNTVLKLNLHDVLNDPKWRIQKNLPQPSCFGAATTAINGDIIYTGGGNTPFREARVVADCLLLTQNNVHHNHPDEIFPHTTSDLYTRLPNMNAVRCGHSAVTLFNGSVVVMGGYSGGLSYLSSAEIMDPEYCRWTPLAPMAVARSGMVAAIGPGGAIYVTGGSPDGSIGHKSLERYDTREGRWEILTEMNCERGYTAGCVGSSNNLFVVGGMHMTRFQPGIEVYDFRVDRWRHYGAIPQSRPTPPHIFLMNENFVFGEEEEEEEAGGTEASSVVTSSFSLSQSVVADYFLRANHQALYVM